MSTKHCIVIVDDDTDDREILKDAFETSIKEQEFIFLEHGEQLLQHLEKCVQHALPSLILLDLNMPGKDGRETLKLIKSDPRFQSIPVIVFTTSSSNRDKQTVYGLGANCFISKPDTFSKLVELTNSIARLWLL